MAETMARMIRRRYIRQHDNEHVLIIGLVQDGEFQFIVRRYNESTGGGMNRSWRIDCGKFLDTHKRATIQDT